MAFEISYRKLFSVDILHNYFLSDGNGDNIEQHLMDNYDMSLFMDVKPTQETLKKLRGHQMVFKTSNQGFTVYVKVEGSSAPQDRTPFIALGDDLELTFLLNVKDPIFWNYTDLSFGGNLMYFGNTTPIPSGVQPIPLDTDAILIEEASPYRLDSSADEEFRDSLKHELFGAMGIVHIQMSGTPSVVVAPNNRIQDPARSFKIHFRNRATQWKYINSSDGTELAPTSPPGPHQLTAYGYVEIDGPGGEKLPNASAASPINSSNESEIYI